MKRAAILVSNLRAAGVTLGLREGRLILDAPRGVITPAIQAELKHHKRSLISLIEREEPRTPFDESVPVEEISLLAGLLAEAYLRYLRVPRASPPSLAEVQSVGLALLEPQSVHECVQP